MAENAKLMAGKTVLVTEGTGGIGRATAEALAALGAHVAITGRDLDRATLVAHEISAATGATVDAYAAELSTQADVRRLADHTLAAYPRLDVLVNNVGGFWGHRHVTADGLEHTFALNHLAPFLLTNLLLDRLIGSAPARIVTVSSGAQSMGRIDFGDLQGERSSMTRARASPWASTSAVAPWRRASRATVACRSGAHPGGRLPVETTTSPSRIAAARPAPSRSCSSPVTMGPRSFRTVERPVDRSMTTGVTRVSPRMCTCRSATPISSPPRRMTSPTNPPTKPWAVTAVPRRRAPRHTIIPLPPGRQKSPSRRAAALS